MEVAIILGNRMNDDGTLSYRMKTRLALALKLITQKSPSKIIVSGGLANKKAGMTEADAMEKWLVENGVPQDMIIKEDKSLTTKQNAKFAAPIAAELHADKVWLCTSREHIARTYLNPIKLFERQLKKYNIDLEAFTNNIISEV